MINAKKLPYGILTLLGLIPLGLCFALAWYEARMTQRNEASAASMFVESQIHSILLQAQKAAVGLVPVANRPCADLMPELLQRAADVPYLRSLNVVEQNVIYCSSASWVEYAPLSVFDGAPYPVPAKPWVKMVNSTPMFPQRPALLVGEPVSADRSVIAIVDDRYLLDLLNAVAPLDVFLQVELQIGDGPVLGGRALKPGELARANTWLVWSHKYIDVGETTVELRFYGLQASLYKALRDSLLVLLPLGLIFSAIFVWVGYWYIQRFLSERERLLLAIRRKEFYMVYQPQVDLNTGRCIGVEALMRWTRNNGEVICPSIFIEMAEQEKVIVPLTRHMLELIAQDVSTWRIPDGLYLSINFSPEHLSSDDLQCDVLNFIDMISGFHGKVVLEITERSLVQNTETAFRNLEVLRRHDVLVAVDDFGTGYCSFSYLEKFPIDILKIDRGFVLTIEPEHGEALILDTIIELGLKLDVVLIAEGVETKEQLDYLRRHKVDQVQGGLFALPMRPDEFLRWYADFAMPKFLS